MNIDIFRSFYNKVEQRQNELNRLNVFPIPDKDTGTNMERTLKIFNKESDDYMSELLYNSRGSSGSILSLFFMGYLSGNSLKESFINGYNSVLENMDDIQDGTMISLMKLCSEIEYQNDFQYVDDCENRCIFDWLDGPNRLKILKKYHTYDSGGLGFLYFLDSLNQSYNNISYMDNLDSIVKDIEVSTIEEDYPRYCLEFMIDNTISKDTLENYGNEIICVSQNGMNRIHIHTDIPDSVLEFARTLGNVSSIKIDDNKSQI